MAHCLNKINHIRMSQESVIVQRIYRGRGLKVGFVPRRFRNIKLHLQACQCVHVNKLYLINTSCCCCCVWPCCVCASQIPSMTHKTKKIICHVYIIRQVHSFCFWRLESEFWKFLFEHERQIILKCLFLCCEHIFMLNCSEK